MENEIYYNGASEEDVDYAREMCAREAAYDAARYATCPVESDWATYRSLYSGGGRGESGEIAPLRSMGDA